MPTRTMRRAFGLTILNSQHNDVRKLKREGNVPEIHGNKFWNSSFLIMDYLRKHPPGKQTRVLEIGCGWGLLGLYCAKTFGCSVHGIDADENVLPYLELHAEANGVTMTSEQKTFEALNTRYLSRFDLIVGADICFWDEMTGVLFNLIGRARRAGVKQVMIADPCRPPFNDLVEKTRTRFDDVTVVDSHLKRPVNASGEILIVEL
ncbi:MAG: methyltransferase domain-containing protein [Proteobacteria bacterium]|jgi:predicted nicotinamide N-methyase|nr:methyltransferase domain-containing protein [Pseudomonadota bacterium]MDA1299763.1 methyltransferase domain-containing protein [Pseudomonadota bacterium]